MTTQNYYLDTDILLYYFDETADLQEIAKTTINQIKSNQRHNSEINVKISQIVLGELLLAFYDKKCKADDVIELLLTLKIDMPNTDSEILNCALDLLREDQLLQPNDALIVAHLLKDTSAKWLFTTDQILIGNLVIDRKMKEYGVKFHIASSF